MADGKKKQPLSLNQLHSRILLDLSASQSKPKPIPVDNNIQSEMKLDEAFESTEGNDSVPRFDLGTPSPPLQGKVNVEEPVSKLKESSPRLFGGIADFDSPSSTLVKAFEPHESRKATEEDGSSSETNPTISNSFEYNSTRPVGMELKHIELESTKISEKEDYAAKKSSSLSGVADLDSSFPGEERQVKVRIEGRRRLCRISKNNDSDAGAGKNFVRDEEPIFDGISDFDSPLQVNKTCETKGNEIRDILNDLSARLEILSIEKRRVPKKVDFTEDFQESMGSKLYDMSTREGFPEYQAASSSHLLSSDSAADVIESKVGGTFTNEHPKERAYDSEVKDDSYAGKANRTKCGGLNKNEPMRLHVESGSAEESQAYNYRREEEDCDSDDYVALSERHTIKQVDRKQGEFIEVSDEESDEVTILDDHVDDFTLSGPKGTYKLPSRIAKMLYPHQREGLKWLWSLHCKGKGGILGDDMGLGKTMQLHFFSDLQLYSWTVPLKFD